MNFPCPNRIDLCPDGDADAPIQNTTSEAPDSLRVFRRYYRQNVYRDGYSLGFCDADDPEDALLCAARAATRQDQPGTLPTVFGNTPQYCAVNCGDGNISEFTTGANFFTATSQAAADALAAAYACEAANENCPALLGNSAQQCQVTCPNGFTIQNYIVAANSFFALTQAEANSAAMEMACEAATALCSTGSITLKSSAAQACTIVCGDGHEVSFTVRAGVAVALTQAEADARALNLACVIASKLCDNVPPTFLNVAQTCSALCGSTLVEYTLDAGVFRSTSQFLADASANAFACVVVARICESNGPIPPQPLVRNGAQRCAVNCPNGGTFTYSAQAGLFLANNRATADLQASSYACSRAYATMRCAPNITPTACVGTAYLSSLAVSGGIGYELVSGTIPPGLTVAANRILGIPSAAGTYSFTIRIWFAGNHFASRTYSIQVGEITTSSLPGAANGTPYAAALGQSGFTNPTWSIVGSLPPGLALNPNTGVIAGTPSGASGNYSFTAIATDPSGLTCSRALSIGVATLTPWEWWKMDEVSGNRIGSILGTVMTPAAGAVGSNTGKINLAAVLTGGFNDLETTNDPTLAYQGNGLDFFGWVRMDAFNPFGWLLMNYVETANNNGIELYFTFDNFPFATGIHCIVEGDDNVSQTISIPFTFVAGDWIFWRVFYDPVTTRWGLQINDGAITLSGVEPWSAKADGIVVFGGFGVTVRIDETGLFMSKLTEAEASQIYNSGAGMTFP